MSLSLVYRKRPMIINSNTVGAFLCGDKSDENLVALANMLVFHYTETYEEEVHHTEADLITYVLSAFKASSEDLEDIPVSEVERIGTLLGNIHTHFSLQPCLSGHCNFRSSPSLSLCNALGFPLFHGWVVDPQVAIYDTIKEFSYDQLVAYRNNLEEQDEHRAICKSLLRDSKIQMTSYGLATLCKEVRVHASGQNHPLALLYWRNKLQIMLVHHDDILVFVTDEGICNQMNDAYWMLLEEHQKGNIYFSNDLQATQGQPFLEKAIEKVKEWERKAKAAAKNKKKKEKRINRQMRQGQGQPPQQGQGQPDQRGESDGEAAQPGNEEVKSSDELRREDDQQGESDGAAPEPANEREVKSSDELRAEDDKIAEAVVSHQIEDDKSAQAVDDQQGESDGAAPALANEREVKSSVELRAEDDKSAQVVVSHAVEDLNSVGSSADKGTKAVGSPRSDNSLSQDDVPDMPDGPSKQFLTFLLKFQEEDSSEPYFKGIAAAFSSHRPLFYVPYEFIVAHNEELALNIQDNFQSISKDLEKCVVWYLRMNEVKSPDDAKLRIIGLPLPKSVQLFLDYFGSIITHVHYAVYGEDPEVLPSPDSRTMALGFLDSIVAKFRTGRCWYGKWSEEHMKVKDRSKFYIDYKEDYPLDSDGAYADLSKFGSTVLDRLKHNEEYPPYIAEFSVDIKMVNECFTDDVKWERFLQLVSYPLGLKPPLVRASLFCDVYMAANANSSGEVPRYNPLFSKRDCIEWQYEALKHPLLRKVYLFQNIRKLRKWRDVIDHWSSTHWHIFKFSRHFIQYVLVHTKGDDMIQKVKDIGVVDLWLCRAISKSIAASVRFLVLNLGVDGIFSTPWRHYIGSDYIDNPNGNVDNATTGDMVKRLVDNISDPVNCGSVYSEVSVDSEPQHLSVIFTEADLIALRTVLSSNGFEGNLDADGCLHCGSVSFVHTP